ncbi:cAMP-binding protein (plasmid) [Exiguobacterium sp. N4-1P]|uniref:Crp/Fnr family transcriptional regulator n=1 Tax=Exiguobacterium sp. N4-1P TaxID=2051906 RepID=UPI000B595E67|nr:Crp/Fnr family transcriptional regulator [Exiguobacterium sp. N4-1P]ASI35382.1 cAMP-binding protein [Exiguobacterium sp. N4-1P]ASI37395.1 cAMP-binding protein [Exiguobacterium sp. N4-1P]
MDKLKLLSQISLFEELPTNELQLINDASEMVQLKRGDVILSPHQRQDALFFLKEGQVRLYRMNKQGKQFTVDVLVGGNTFGETATLSLTDDDIYAEAMTDTCLCIMPTDQFETFIESNPKIAMKLIQVLSNRLKDVYSFSEHLALNDVKYRIVYLLLKLSEKSGTRHKQWQSIDLKLTHTDIAQMIGSTRETTSLILNQLKKEEVLKKELYFAIDANRASELLNQF